MQLLGVEVLSARLPDSYIRAIFGAYLASHFTYQYGLNAPEFAFFDFSTMPWYLFSNREANEFILLVENYMKGSSGLTEVAL